MRINDAAGSLLSVFLDWNGFLVNNKFARSGSVISWNNYQRRDFVDVVTRSTVLDLIDNGQYSFQVGSDGSIFQIYYKYSLAGRTLEKACLAFYYLEDSQEADVDYGLWEAAEISAETSIGWLRVDYGSASDEDGGVTHSKCHMHLSAFPAMRLIVDRVPNPKQFVEFVIAMCYPGEYKRHRLDERGRFTDKVRMSAINNPLLDDIDVKDVCDFMMHLHIPTTVVAPLAIQQTTRGKRRK